MNTYKAPSVKVVILDLTATICEASPYASASTEKLEEDEFQW